MAYYDPDPGRKRRVRIPASIRPYPGLVKAWLRRKGLADPDLDPEPARRRRRTVRTVIMPVYRRIRRRARIPTFFKWGLGLLGVYLGYSKDADIDSAVSSKVPQVKGYGTPIVGGGVAIASSVVPGRGKMMQYVKQGGSWLGGGMIAGWLVKKLMGK
jgi:hypothetical protein